MKKYALLLLVLTLVVGCLMAFSSCGDKPAPTPDDPTCEHAWNAGEVTTPATCTAAGVKTFTCTKCNETKTEAIGSLGHAWDTDFTVDTPATCSAKGSKSIHCANCNEKKDVTEIDTVSHNYVYTVTKEATLLADGSSHGVCSACSAVDDKVIAAGSNVDVVTAATSSPFKYNKNYEDILEEGQHFYPTAENPEGNDLFFEFSLLWNETVKNNANLKTIGIRLWGAKGDNNTTIFEFNLKDGISGQWGTTAGSFEPCNCNGKTAAEIYTEASKFKGTSNSGYNDLPNFGDFGWHRIGFQVHQEAELVDGEIKTSALLSVYLDGEMVLQYHMNAAKLIEKGGVLFKTELVDGAIKYSDNTGFGPYIYFENFGSATDMVFPFADVNFSCGKDFVQKVAKVDAPEAKDFKVSDTVTLPGAMHYAPSCDHDIAWTVTKDVTLLADGTKTGTCSVCGKEFNEVIPAGSNAIIFDGTNSSAPSGWGAGTNLFNRIYLSQINSDLGAFYPTEENPEGQDLLMEMSILWNNTLNVGTGKGNFTFGLFDKNGGSPTAPGVWVYIGTGDSDCPYYGGIQPGYATSVLEGKPGPIGGSADQFAYVGGNGWHRVGIRYHQDAAIVDGEVQYTMTISVYWDGELVCKYVSNISKYTTSTCYLLYKATVDAADPTKLVYSANTDDSATFSAFRLNGFFGSSTEKWFAIGDYSLTAGQNFVQKVEKVTSPDNTVTFEVAEGVNLPGTMYYAAACDHDIAWTVTKDATMFADGAKTGTCSVCSKEFNEVIPVGSNTVIYSSNEFKANGDTSFKTPSYLMSELDHFYPTEENPNGKDLIAEFSILWNNSIENDTFVNNLYLFRFHNPTDDNSGTTTVWLHPGIADTCAPKFGAFELNKADKVLVGPQQGGAWKDGDALKKAGVAVNDANFDDYYYVLKGEGWHRIGMRLHEDVTLNGNEVVYKEIFTIYVDGEVVISYECASSMPKLYKAEVVDGKLVYSDAEYVAKESAFTAFQYSNFVGDNNGSYLKDRYLGIADASVSVGTEFVQNVEKVASPDTSATFEVAEGVTVPGTMYFQLKTVE